MPTRTFKLPDDPATPDHLGITPAGWRKVFGTTIALTGLLALAEWGPPALMPAFWIIGMLVALYCGWKLVR